MTASLASSVVTPRGVAVLIAVVMVGLFLFILGWSLLQTRRRTVVVPPTPGEAAAGAKPKRVPVARRDFLRRGLLAALAVFAAEFGGASLAFLWPNLKGQFGSLVTAGSLDDIKSYIEQNNQPFYLGAGRFYIVPYNGSGTDTIYAGLTEQGLMALYQRCVHLGCRVPFCQASQWFECPCHGSKYNEAGEYMLGPAPTGLDRFPLRVEGTEVQVDTSQLIGGPPRGTNTIHEPPQGPSASAAPPADDRGDSLMTTLGIEAGRGVTIAFAVFVVAVFLGGAAYLMLRRPRRKGTPDIPPAMKPGPADAQLEKPRLERMQAWGIVTVVVIAIWIPAVWLNEPKQNETDQRNFNAASVAAGAASVQLNSESNPTGIGCVRCHGPGLSGGYNVFNGTVVPVPDLQTVCGGPKYGHAQIHSLTDVVNTIAEGRTGTDMPSWSVKFAGSLDDQQINDIVNYILSIQKVPFKDNVCINPQAGASA